MSDVLNQIFLSEYRRSRIQALERAGFVFLLVYAFSWLALYEVAQIAESVIFILFIIVLMQRPHRLRGEPLLYLMYAWLLYQFLFIPWVILEFPETASGQISWARHYAKLGLVVVVAWWIGGAIRNISIVLALIVAGFLCGVTFQDGGVLDSLEQIKRFERTGLGYNNWEHASVYAALSLMILLCLRQRIISLFGKFRWLGWSMVVAGVLYSSLVVMVTQTRATWLGLVVACMTGLIVWVLTRNRTPDTHSDVDTDDDRAFIRSARRYLKYALVVMVISVVLFSTGMHKMIAARLSQEGDVISALMQGRTEEVRLSNIGIRVVIWMQGLEWISERPIFGWGPRTRAVLFVGGELPEEIRGSRIRHFHNQPIELAVGYGLVGLAVFSLALFIILRAAYRAWRDGRMPKDLLIFGAAFLSYWIVVNMFESYFNYSTGAYINALIGGAFFTFRFTESGLSDMTVRDTEGK